MPADGQENKQMNSWFVPMTQATPRRNTQDARGSVKENRPGKAPKRTNRSQNAKPSRRPGWDDDVRTTSTFFDGSLNKASIFQPRSGDRQCEIREEEKTLSGRSAAPKKATARRSKWDSRIASSLPMQLPKRRQKDYVKLNVEQITGRPFTKSVGTKQGNYMTPSTRREVGTVFDRLSAPLLHKSVLRFRSPSPTRKAISTQPVARAPLRVSESAPKLFIESPMVPSSLRQDSPRSRPSSIQRLRSSPNQDDNVDTPSFKGSLRSRHSSPKLSRRSLSPEPSPIARENQSIAARVFEILDRQGKRRIGINQILDGLKLLGLPSTHNQVSDYVYLIHEGALNTIDFDDWIILVGTLEAASQPSLTTPVRPDLSPRLRVVPLPSRSPPACSTSISSRGRRASSVKEDDEGSPTHGFGFSDAALEPVPPNPTVNPDNAQEEWYMEAIQRRVDEMYARAEEAVAHRVNPTGSEHLLKRAASAVYELKASLFPLVDQAEGILNDIQNHRSTKLTLVLRPSDLNKIVDYSEDLADAILDDLLLDTVEQLNAQERDHSRQVVYYQQTEQLDSIMHQIEAMERIEKDLLENGAALGYSTTIMSSTLPITVRAHDTESHTMLPVTQKEPPPSSTTHENIVLPLEILMQLEVDEKSDEEVQDQRHENVADDLMVPVDFNPDSTRLRLSHRAIVPSKVSMAAVGGSIVQRLEKTRLKFLKHRRLVESSLEDTGMDQAAVIEILAGMMLDDIVLECAAELDDGVSTLSDTLIHSLV
ncbi:hypothetical protein Poli38472_005248 [Pythium oligandrum]|uniref:EF-hand domain-containing protein n=1 Tax=Pythium oligandrum TaxID=41045 RepID=A0A8K1CH57_PYTOL|nr:hypothetical protein Poli38472_005248 [Pythium oligandrum]|eukprot:TMW62630.1 hypothetical protein Poli38472_005248 [Pythium oligandrum]